MDYTESDFKIGDIFKLKPKRYYGARKISSYGEQYKIIEKNGDCLLFESLEKGSKFNKCFRRWVNIYFDEEFSIGDKV